jgi:hypothetical protein
MEGNKKKLNRMVREIDNFRGRLAKLSNQLDHLTIKSFNPKDP